MLTSLTLKSPAKINLFLHILGRLPNGYHALHSAFQALTLHDTLKFIPSSADILICDNPQIPTTPDNLILRAAALFRERTKTSQHYKISLTKRIPSEAGLGGGSSNAATTLWALNECAGRPASATELAHWGEELGADVPFFFSSGHALCSGIGAVERDLEPASPTVYQLIKPANGLSTAAVFKALNAAPVHETPSPQLDSTRNDLLQPALELSHDLRQLFTHLQKQGFQPRLSGSGSCLFLESATTPRVGASVWQATASPCQRSHDGWYDC